LTTYWRGSVLALSSLENWRVLKLRSISSHPVSGCICQPENPVDFHLPYREVVLPMSEQESVNRSPTVKAACITGLCTIVAAAIGAYAQYLAPPNTAGPKGRDGPPWITSERQNHARTPNTAVPKRGQMGTCRFFPPKPARPRIPPPGCRHPARNAEPPYIQPSRRAVPQPVARSQQATAGEELPRVGQVTTTQIVGVGLAACEPHSFWFPLNSRQGASILQAWKS
jgi:hypothetical protein